MIDDYDYDFLEYDDLYEPTIRVIPVSTTLYERKVLLRDANVRAALKLLEEDLKEVLTEYDEATSLLSEKIEEVLRRYDGDN